MKKLFFIAVIAGAALVSCTKNEVAPVAEQQEITFAAPVVGPQTKAIPGELTGAAYPVGENFNVYGVWHSGDFAGWASSSLYMDDVKTTYDDTFNGWRPNDRHYWPKNGQMTFAAYSPSDVNAASHSYAANGLTLVGFQVEADAKNHIDVLYSKRSYNKEKASTDNVNTPYDEVDIDFMHALSSIQFTAKTAMNYGTTEIKLKKIAVYGVYSKGDFVENVDETTPGTYKATPTWLSHDAYNQIVDKTAAYVYYNNATGQTLSDAKWVMNGQANQTDLICLPQTLPTNATVVITYSINPPAASTPEVDVTLETKINALSTTWEPGKRYTYNLTIGLDEIYFAPEVTDWVEEVSVDIPTI